MSWEQLRGLGETEQQVRTLAEKGILIRLHRGVYAVGHTRLTAKGRWMAAVLACGEGARLSHGDAAALWDLRRIPSGLTHVTAPCSRRHAGVRAHRTRHPERLGAMVIDAIPVTTLARTLLDLAASDLPPQRLRTHVEAAERLRILDAHAVAREIERSAGHKGTGRLAQAIALVSDTPPELRSGLEARFLEVIRAAGLPEPSTNVVVDDEPVDAYWPQYDLIVEVDGWLWHRGRRSFTSDRAKRNRLILAGHTVLVFDDDTVETAAPAQISRAIADAAASGR